MGFFTRLSTVIAADAHGVVDAIEDDELVLKQCLREAEAELGRKRAHLESLELDERRLRELIGAGRQNLAGLESDVALALEQEQDELARFALRRLLPLRRDLEVRERRVGLLQEEAKELRQRLAGQERDFDDLRARVRDHVAALQARGAGEDDGGWGLGGAVASEEVELELLRRRRATGGAL